MKHELRLATMITDSSIYCITFLNELVNDRTCLSIYKRLKAGLQSLQKYTSHLGKPDPSYLVVYHHFGF
jgi:hypothetical protein